MTIEIKLKDDVLNRHLFHNMSIESLKDLLQTNPKLLLKLIEKWEESMKDKSGKRDELDYTSYNYHP